MKSEFKRKRVIFALNSSSVGKVDLQMDKNCANNALSGGGGGGGGNHGVSTG